MAASLLVTRPRDVLHPRSPVGLRGPPCVRSPERRGALRGLAGIPGDPPVRVVPAEDRQDPDHVRVRPPRHLLEDPLLLAGWHGLPEPPPAQARVTVLRPARQRHQLPRPPRHPLLPPL